MRWAKPIIWIIVIAALFAAPYFVHHRGWDALVALLALLAAFTYLQCVER